MQTVTISPAAVVADMAELIREQREAQREAEAFALAANHARRGELRAILMRLSCAASRDALACTIMIVERQRGRVAS